MKAIINKIKKWFFEIKKRREFKNKLAELRKRDPFIYRH